VSLAEARDQATDYRRQARKGIDPRTERDKLKAPAQEVMTFQKAAELFIASKGDGWKNKKHAQQWTNTLKTYAFPIIGDLPCSDVTTEHIVDILKPIWSTKNETATRIRGRIENVMDWATVMGQRSGENPARWKGKLQVLLPTISKRRRIKHHPAMPYLEVPALFKTIGSNPILSAQALIFCILTATRTSETIEAKWSEFDFEKELWVIPKDRMKKEKEHRVPLSAQAINLLKQVPKITGNNKVFPSPKGFSLSDNTLSKLMRDMRATGELSVDAVPHGFRSTFRDWAAEQTAYPDEIRKAASGHRVGDSVQQAYQRTDLLEKRRKLMNEWANFLDKPRVKKSENVIPLRMQA
jgi:integrase